MQNQSPLPNQSRQYPQQCIHLDTYLLEDDWMYLEQAENVQARLIYLRDICQKIGIAHPSEKTLQVAIAIFLCTGGRAAEPPQQQYEYYCQLKTLFHTFRPAGRHDLPHLFVYPAHPRHLEPGWKEHAYGDMTFDNDLKRAYHISMVAKSVPTSADGSAPASADGSAPASADGSALASADGAAMAALEEKKKPDNKERIEEDRSGDEERPENDDEVNKPVRVRKRLALSDASDASHGFVRVDWARNQVVAKSGPGKYKTFGFKNHGGPEGARSAASDWVNGQNK